MPGRFSKRYEVDVEDVERLVNCIVEHATEDEGREAERLLAILTMLRATAEQHGEPAIAFTAPRGTSALVDRALAAIARSDKHAARAARHRPRRPRAERDAAFGRQPRAAL